MTRIMPTSREDQPVSTPADTGRYGDGGRRHPPKQFPAQLILMTDLETASFVRRYAVMQDRSVAAVLREFVQDGIDTLPSQTREAVSQALAAEDDDERAEG